MKLLDSQLEPQNTNMLLRLGATIAACSQLSTLTTPQRIWSLKKLHSLLTSKLAPKPLDPSLSSILMPLLPGLLKQYEYEESQVRGGVHLMHSEYFKTLAALACDMQLDSLLPPSDVHKWTWFKRYCIAVRVAQSLINRTELPRLFCLEVRKKLTEMLPNQTVIALTSATSELTASLTSINSRASTSSSVNYESNAVGGPSVGVGHQSDADSISLEQMGQFLHEDHSIFKAQHDRQLLQWLNRR